MACWGGLNDGVSPNYQLDLYNAGAHRAVSRSAAGQCAAFASFRPNHGKHGDQRPPCHCRFDCFLLVRLSRYGPDLWAIYWGTFVESHRPQVSGAMAVHR